MLHSRQGVREKWRYWKSEYWWRHCCIKQKCPRYNYDNENGVIHCLTDVTCDKHRQDACFRNRCVSTVVRSTSQKLLTVNKFMKPVCNHSAMQKMAEDHHKHGTHASFNSCCFEPPIKHGITHSLNQNICELWSWSVVITEMLGVKVVIWITAIDACSFSKEQSQLSGKAVNLHPAILGSVLTGTDLSHWWQQKVHAAKIALVCHYKYCRGRHSRTLEQKSYRY